MALNEKEENNLDIEDNDEVDVGIDNSESLTLFD